MKLKKKYSYSIWDHCLDADDFYWFQFLNQKKLKLTQEGQSGNTLAARFSFNCLSLMNIQLGTFQLSISFGPKSHPTATIRRVRLPVDSN